LSAITANGRALCACDTTPPGNGGHDFDTTLPDGDNTALVEYLKTL